MTEVADHEILLVEDNPSDVDLFKAAMAESDVDGTLRVAQTGDQGLTVLEEESVDIAILDLHLPDKSGLRVLEELNQDADPAATPVLIFSSAAEAAEIREAYELGANAYLVKRFDFEDTVDLVDSLNDFWLEAAELPPG